MLFVYLLEAEPRFGPRVREIHEEMMRRGNRLCTSVFTVGEVLTGPLKKGAGPIADRIRSYFRSDAIDVIPFDFGTAETYSRIRAANSVRGPDAIHLASAAQARSDLFLTNDHRLLRLTVPGISFIAGLEARLF
jgi:predicted nucleic acid-binding protein